MKNKKQLKEKREQKSVTSVTQKGLTNFIFSEYCLTMDIVYKELSKDGLEPLTKEKKREIRNLMYNLAKSNAKDLLKTKESIERD